MLVSAAADIGFVLHRALVWTACACSLLVVTSFGLFVRDQVSAGSKQQQGLTSPFRSIVASDSDWVNRGLPTIFALLGYGGGLGFLARYSRGRA